ncbi:MAG: Methyl-coenzyme M reductase I operon protein D [Methanomassiliicoccales archaeon PtaU1.Bin124]|nr:MAG: Methyl-coenzyme M reductase I operon protein D [Methanomassiliicoccales archaeon PtaU1.Bin124]
MSKNLPEQVPLPEILIFPARLLKAETTEKLLNRVYEVPHVRHVTVSGESLPSTLTSGPGKGMVNEHPERRKIKVKGEDIELRLLVGRIFVEVEDVDYVDGVLTEVDEVCKEILPFGYSLEVGRYSKFKPTVTDYKKQR